ncbi:MAG TPA: Ran-binding zinc finger domain-containing protein [Gemmatimonadaceae bacterium]|jgi:hypothetical protein
MTESNRSMNDVHALLDERRRYEAWLAALDERRETTPPHVFERVQADYRGRLRQVADRLASHRQTIEDEKASVVSRLSLLGAEEQMRRDERAELDLRAHVGELAEQDAAAAFGAVDEAIQHLAGEKVELERRVADLDALLSDQPNQSGGATEPESPSDAAKTPAFDELAFLDAVVSNTPTEDVRSSTSEPAYERIVTPDESDAESLLQGLEASTRASSSPPLAANVASNTPIVLRTSGALEQSKTLKCNECGAMNYPTEWYCERCGAELAAL